MKAKNNSVFAIIVTIVLLFIFQNGYTAGFSGTWKSQQTCDAEAPYQQTWQVTLSQSSDQVSGTIYFHKCPGGGRASYSVSGTAIGDNTIVSLEGTKTSSRGGLGSSAPSSQTFIITYNEAPCPDLTQTFSSSGCAAAPTPTPTPTPTPDDSTTTIEAEVQSTTGQVIAATLVGVANPGASDKVSDVVALVTLDASSTTIIRDDNSVIEVEENTVATLNPSAVTGKSITLVRGKITTTFDCTNNPGAYTVNTPAGTITFPDNCSSNKRAGETSAKFTTNYSQNGLQGSLVVSVISGSVTVTDRDNNQTVVSAGSDKTISTSIPRSSWVMPIDKDKIYGGQQNLFVWTAYPGASGYILEYNLPNPTFSEDNPTAIEFNNTKVVLRPGAYSEYNGLILFDVFIGSTASKILAEGRVFAIDANNNIISGNQASDKITVDWE